MDATVRHVLQLESNVRRWIEGTMRYKLQALKRLVEL